MDDHFKLKEELIRELQELRQELGILKKSGNHPITDLNYNDNVFTNGEERWRFAIEATTDGVWDWDLTANRVFYSRQWKEMLGFSESDIGDSSEEWSNRIHPEDVEKTLVLINSHLKGEAELYSAEHRIRCKDGNYKWILTEGKVVNRDTQGKALRIVGTHKDITQRKTTEFILKDRLKKLDCHNRVSEVISNPDLPMDEVCQKILVIIPPAWQFPELTEVAISIYDKIYTTPDYHKTENSLYQEIKVNRKVIGQIDVCYSDKFIPLSEPIFLPEESDLLFSIALKIGSYLEINKAGKELRENEERLRVITESALEAIILMDPKGNISYWNPAAEHILGYRQDEVIGKNLHILLAPDRYHYAHHSAFPEFVKTGRGLVVDQVIEMESRHKNGEEIYIELSISKIRINEGWHAVGFLRDMTKKKRILESLRMSELKYRNLVESINDIVFEVAMDGTIKYLSPSIEKLFNYKPDDLVGQNFFMFVHPKDRLFLIDVFKNNRFSEHKYIEYRCLTNAGMTIWVQVSARHSYENGKLVGRTGILHDITEQKLADEKLRKSEEQYRKLVESVNDVIYEIDASGKIKFVSPSVSRILGYSVEEVAGRNIFDFIYPEDVPTIMNTLKNLSGMDYNYMEYRYLRKDGSINWVRSSTSPLLENGIMTGGTGILTDITERKKTEIALNESEEKFSKAFNTAPYAITITSIDDGKFIDVNESFTEYTGYTKEEALTDSSVGLKLWKNQSDRESVVAFLRLSKSVLAREYDFVKKDGSQVTSIYSASVIHLDNKSYILSSITDISDRKLADEKIEKLSRLYLFISHVNQAIVHLRVKEQLIHEVCRIAIKYGKFQLAWIGLVDEDTQLVKPVFADGFEDGFLTAMVPISVSDLPEKRGPIGSAIKEGNHFVFNDIQSDPRVGAWREEALKRGYRSSITLPLQQFGKIAGTFTLYSSQPDFFIPEEIELLDEFVEEISFAFESIEIENERRKAEDQLRKLSSAVEQSPVSIVIANVEGNIEYVNPKACETTGYTYQELVGKNPRILKSGETLAKDYEILWGEISGGNQWNGVFHNKRKNGELYWESSTISPIIGPNGNITHYLAIKEDITKRKKTEEALLLSEERFRQLAEQSKTVIWEVDQTGLYTYVSPMSQSVWGYTPDELIGSMHFYDLHALEDREAYKNATLESFSRKENFNNVVNQVVKKNEEIIFVTTNCVPIVDAWNNLVGYRGADNDITERKVAEDELLKFRTITDQANYGSAITTIDGSLLYINDTFAQMHGYEADELIGKNLAIFHNEEQLPKVAEQLNLLKDNGSFYALELWHTKRDGTVFPTLMNALIIFDQNHNPQFMSATAIDITEKKLAEEALRISEAALNHAQEISMMCSWELNLITEQLTWSKNYYNVMGIPPGTDMKTDFFIERVHPDDVYLVNEKLEEMRSFKKPVTYDLRLMMPNKEYKWIENNIVPEFEGENLVRFKGVNIDVTEKKLAENSIKQQNERLNAIIKAIPDLIFVSDRNGTYLEYYNFNSHELLYPENQLIGSTVRDVFDGETANLHIQKIQECTDHQTLVTYEYSAIRNGVISYYEARLAPLGKDRTLRFVRDFTDRRLKDNEIKKLSMAVEQSPVIIVITDINGNIEYVNPAFQLITGYAFDEVLGQNTRFLKSGKTDPKTYEDLWNTITSGGDWSGEWINKKKDGELYWENVSIKPIRDANGKITSYLAVKQDITQRKKIEQEIRDLNINLELKIEERTVQLATINSALVSQIEERKLAEEALQVKTAELENFFEVTPDLLSITDMKGKFIKVNKAWNAILGYSIKTLENKYFYELIHKDDIQPSYHALNELNTQLPVINFTNRYKAKDGQYRFIEWHSVPVGDLIYSAARDITERKLAADFENELLQLSPSLTGLPLSKINDAINLALRRIGEFLSADRSYIFEFDPSEKIMNNTHEWCNIGVNPEIGNQQNLACGILPNWMETLQKHENIVIYSVTDLPECRREEREFFGSKGIKSLIVIPMLAERTLIGFVGLDSITEQKVYNPSEINILKVWSSMLASLINNQRTESILEQTRQNYETFFNTIDDFLFVIDQQGNIIHTNKTVNSRLEFTKEELFNQSILSVLPVDRREEAGRIVGEMLAGITEYCPVPIVSKSGLQIPVETRVKPGFWNGNPVIFGVSKDITQIKLSEQKFSSAFHANATMMAISDFYTGKHIDINNAFVEVLGFSRDEVLGKTNKELGIFVDPNLRDEIISKLLQNIPVKKIEVVLRAKEGKLRTGLLSCDSIYIGDVRCLLSVNMDITERKKAEEETKEARIEAEKANQAKSEFLSRMSHELRTPMNSILGFAQLLQMNDLNQRQRMGVNHIINSGKHLLDLINEVLDISRIEAGRIFLSVESVQISDIVLEMIDAVHPLAAMRKQKLEFINSPANQLYIRADRQRFKQVLMNLLSNAIKYDKEAGLITIQTQVMPKSDTGDVPIRISISDTGLGISAENIPKLFKPFERIGAERTQTEGTGLGLAVVKKLMEVMGGTIGVESVPGTGSTFWVELPQIKDQPKSVENIIDLKSQDIRQTSMIGKILYIEDNVSNIELVEQIITTQRPGIQINSNTNGDKAVQLAIDLAPDLILLDLNLPDISGYEVFLFLQAEEKTKSIPVVVISADAMPYQFEKLLNAGVKNYLIKPLDIQDFLKEVDKWVIDHEK